MAIIHHPKVGTILRVDLNEGFRVPEMRKRRPAIVLSPDLAGRSQLCTIIPLSTTPPRPPRPYNYLLKLDPPLPHPYIADEMWVKADMIMCVAFHRLKLLGGDKDASGERVYDVRVLPDSDMVAIKECVRLALDL